MKRSTWTVRFLVQGSCMFGLVALALMALSILVPRALPIIAAMTLAQLLGAGAFFFYLMAIVSEIRRNAQLQRTERATSERSARGDQGSQRPGS